MDAVLITFAIAALCWLGLFAGISGNRKYKKNARKIGCEVLSWEKRVVGSHKTKVNYYDLEVLGEDGEHYSFSTSSRKARKYKRKKNAVIYVPNDYRPLPPTEEVEAMLDSMAKICTEADQLRIVEEARQNVETLNTMRKAGEVGSYGEIRLVEETKKGAFNLLLFIIALIYTAFTVIAIGGIIVERKA